MLDNDIQQIIDASNDVLCIDDKDYVDTTLNTTTTNSNRKKEEIAENVIYLDAACPNIVVDCKNSSNNDLSSTIDNTVSVEGKVVLSPNSDDSTKQNIDTTDRENTAATNTAAAADAVSDSNNNNDKQIPKCRRRNPDRKRFGARNHNRMKVLTKWILYTFHDTIFAVDNNENNTNNTTSNNTIIKVIDVAGGKGELAARLCICHNIHVTMIDPRPCNILNVYNTLILPKLPNKWQNSIMIKLKNDSNFLHNIITERYQQLIMYFDSYTTNTISTGSNYTTGNTGNFLMSSSLSSSVLQVSNSSTETETTVPEQHPLLCISTNELLIQKLQTAIVDCDLIIGMHSDSATECIIDVALQYNKPFVVIPCCVFPNFFQKRYIKVSINIDDNDDNDTTNDKNNDSNPDGTSSPVSSTCTSTTTKIEKLIEVRSYEQFCTYLLQKDKRFQKDILQFDGRNVAIWWDGK